MPQPRFIIFQTHLYADRLKYIEIYQHIYLIIYYTVETENLLSQFTTMNFLLQVTLEDPIPEVLPHQKMI